MIKPSYSFYDISGFDNKAQKELKTEFKKLGIPYKAGSFGGGVPVQQIVAWLNLHSDSISVGVISSFIVQILNQLFSWYRRNKPANEKIDPVVNISIYINDKYYQKSYSINKSYVIDEIDLSDIEK